MFALLVAAQLIALPVVACQPPQPGPSWVCQDGGWKHPNDPTIRRQPEPPPPPPPPTVSFVVGRTYTRNTGGIDGPGPAVLYIAAMGLYAGNIPVFFAECRAVGDGCFFPGYIRPIWIGTDAKDWSDVTPK